MTQQEMEARVSKLETDVAYLQGMTSELPTWLKVVPVVLMLNLIPIFGASIVMMLLR